MGREDSGELAGSGIILVHPKFPENIGAAARIAFNFGIAELIVVGPDCYEQERMLKMATHKAAHLIQKLRYCTDTASAAAPFHFIVGTTARRGKKRLEEQSPREVMAQLAALSAGNRIALMFGPESTGLSNEDLNLCQFTSTIPTARFASLNLAQAVAIHCYELHTALNPDPFAALPKSELANSYDLEGMYGHIAEALNTIAFLRDTNHSYWMRNIRQFLGRVRLKKKETSMIRGICRKLLWYDRTNGKSTLLCSDPSERSAQDL